MAKGDHILVKYVGFEHHAIDLGDGTVIEYGGKGAKVIQIRRVSRQSFFERGLVHVVQYPRGSALPPDQVVARAWSRLREQRYNALDNNCEHLAYWCKTGRHWSPQANDVRSLGKVGLVVGGILLAAHMLG